MCLFNSWLRAAWIRHYTPPFLAKDSLSIYRCSETLGLLTPVLHFASSSAVTTAVCWLLKYPLMMMVVKPECDNSPLKTSRLKSPQKILKSRIETEGLWAQICCVLE